MSDRFVFVMGCVVTALAAPIAVNVQAQDWPGKPVRVILNGQSGSPSDITARTLSERWQSIFKQPFVLDSRAGAGGNIGADMVAKSPPDGYTLGVTIDTVFTVNPLIYRKMPFDVWSDIVPISLLGSTSQMLVCNSAVPAKTLRELIALATRQKLSYASGGAGVPGHLAAELLLSMTGMEMTHVPYKGPPAATTDVVGGQVHCGFLATPTVMPHVKAGKLNALAVSTAQRSALAPDVPTAAESGVAGFDAKFYFVLYGPKGTPPNIVAAMGRETNKALAEADVVARLSAVDIVTVGTSADEAAKTLRTIAAKWEPVVKRIGLKVE